MSWVWPRLPAVTARQLLAELRAADCATLRSTSSTTHLEAAPIAVGGRPVPVETIARVQRSIRAVADELGFPNEIARANVATFDRPATRILFDEMEIVPADAASEEVWNFLTLVVLPDVAVWRFPGRADERLLGRPRNAFRRLWWRAETVGVDVIDTADGLGEDEMVNIMERPTLAANPRTARLLARLIHEHGHEAGVARSEVMRDVSKRFLRRQAVVSIDALPDGQVQAILDKCLREASLALVSADQAPRPRLAGASPTNDETARP